MTMTPTALQKLRVFVPQLAMYSLTAAAVTIGSLNGASNVIVAASVVAGIPVGILTLVTTLAKAISIAEGDWSELIPERSRACKGCARLSRENRELTEALATLRLPEERP